MQYADIWFLRFAMDPLYQVLACGSRMGDVFVWDLAAEQDAGRARTILQVNMDNKGKGCTVSS